MVEDRVVCGRVADYPDPVFGTITMRCPECREKVWASPVTVKALEDEPGRGVVCMKCVDWSEVPKEITEEQVREIALNKTRKALGRTVIGRRKERG